MSIYDGAVNATWCREGDSEPKPWQAWAGPALLAATFVALTLWSWQKWPDVLVDFGRELYVPWQLACGKRLYADIAYFNGPLSPWWNQIQFRIFGVGLMTLVVANLAIIVAIASMIYYLIRQFGTRVSATVGALVFLSVFAFGQYGSQGNFNFVAPYSHEMTHGTALSLASLVLLIIHIRRGGMWSALGCGVAVGFTFLTKAEFLVALAAAVPLGFALHHRSRRTALRECIRVGAFFGTGAVLPVALAFLLLLKNMPAETALTGVLGPWAHLFSNQLTDNKLYRDTMGVTDLRGSLAMISGWCFRYLAILAPAAVIGAFLPRSWRFSPFLVGILPVLGASAILLRWRETDWDAVAYPFPVVMLVVALGLLVLQGRSGRTEERRARHVAIISLVLFALVLLAKIFFGVRFSHYGFALAMPAGMVIVVTLLDVIPSGLDRWGKNGTAFRAYALGIIAGVVGLHLYATHSWFELRTVRVGRGDDSFLADDRGRVINDVLERFEELRSPGETLVVVPEGVMLNYLSRTPNPTPYVNFMPPEIIMFGEDEIVQSLQRDPPDWIVFTDRGTPEYGYENLGVDYGVDISRWIELNYAPAAEILDERANRNQLRFAVILRRATVGPAIMSQGRFPDVRPSSAPDR